MPYRIAGIDVHKKVLAVVMADVEIDGDFHFDRPTTMSGRITDLAVYEPNPSIFYVGTAHGGVWKTTNGRTTFEAQFQEQGLISIGDVTVSQSNPDLVWVGSGESNNRQSTSWGDGVYKTTGSTRARSLPRSTATARTTSTPTSTSATTTAARGNRRLRI